MAGSRSALIGVDLGTSSIKVGAFSPSGKLLSLRRVATPTERLRDGWAEHDPEALWAATATLLREVREALPPGVTVDAIAPASVGEAGVAVDGNGTPVRPAIAWFDTRATAQATWWERVAGMAAVNRISGQPIDPHYGVNKLLWIRENEPGAFAAARKWLSLADYLILRLCGEYATDRTLASRTMLFDQRRLDWSDELIALAGLDRGLLPPAHVGGTRVGRLLSDVARETGLPAGTPVATAGHDRLCGAFAARGATDILVDSTGSAEAVVLPNRAYVERTADEAGFVSCYADVVPEQYVYSARIGYAGALLDWLRRDLLGSGRSIGDDGDAISIEELESAIPRPLAYSGLLVYPSFGRVIAPFWNQATRGGAVLGLTLGHRRGHLYQGLLEGVCFSLRANLDWLEDLSGRPVERLRVEGGATRSPVWLQLKADISGRVVEAVRLEEPTALGAALLAGIAVGAFADHKAAGAAIALDVSTCRPDSGRRVAFDAVYRDAYRHLPALLSTVGSAVNRFGAVTEQDA